MLCFAYVLSDMTSEDQTDRIQQLEKRIEELENRQQLSKFSRRGLLGGIAGVAGLGAMSGSGAAASGQVGTANNRVNVFADEINANSSSSISDITTDSIPLTDQSGNIQSFNVIYREVGEFVQILTNEDYFSRRSLVQGENITVDSGYSLAIPADLNSRCSCTSTVRKNAVNTDLILWEIYDSELFIGRLGDSTSYNAGLNSSLQFTGSQNAIPLTIDLTYRKA